LGPIETAHRPLRVSYGAHAFPNQRTWDEQEIDDWYATRPVKGPEPRGAAKRNRTRKADSSTASTTS